MTDSSRATLEVIKERKAMKQGHVPLPGSGDSVVYTGAKRKLSVVETCNGEPGTTTSLRVEVVTDEMVVTAGRPNYRIAIDIPLDEALAGILATALDRAEENAHAYPPSVLRDGVDGLVEEGSDPDIIDAWVNDPTVEAVLEHADREAEKAQVTGLEEDAFGPEGEPRPANNHNDVVGTFPGVGGTEDDSVVINPGEGGDVDRYAAHELENFKDHS